MRRSGDRIGIYTLRREGSVRAVQEITDDAELLRRAANSLKAGDQSSRDGDTSGMTAHAATDYNGLTLTDDATDFKHVLEAIARHLATVPGRKSLIWVTNGFPLFWPPPPAAPIYDFRPEMEAAAHALNDANVALYAVDARGIMGALSGLTAISNAETRGPQSQAQLRQQMHRGEPVSPPGLDTMQFLAGLTGGLVFYNKSNAIEESIRTAVDDGELTYTLGFYPLEAEQSAARHDLKVEVGRRGVSLRYRESYFASNTAAAANERPTLEELLKAPLDATQLALVAETSPDQTRPGSWQVRVTVDLHDVQLERQNDNWVGAVDVSFLIEGSRTAQTITTKVTIPDKLLADALEKGIVVNHSIEMDAKTGVLRGVLRIVAQDPATGAAGSVRVVLGKQ